MNFPPTSIITLVRLLRRDGFAFFGKCVRYAFSRDAWLWLLRGGRHTGDVGIRRSLQPMKAPGASPASGPVPDFPPEERERSRRILSGFAPKISVVVTSYNYAHLIRETLDALVAQTYPAHEILVVDNGSTDGSPDVIREYAAKYPSVRLLQHEGCVNKGLPASVKLGVETATGEFVAFCEADDLWTPDHLEKKVALLRERWGEPNFIINDIELFGDPDRCRQIEEAGKTRLPAITGIRNRISPVLFRERNYIFTFSICMVRRSTLLSCDMLSVPRPSNLDWWLWRQVCFDNDIWCVHEKLTRWRLHKNSYLMRDDTAERPAQIYDLMFAMDRFLVEKHPAQADCLRRFLRIADMSSCSDGVLAICGERAPQPAFTVAVIANGTPDALERTLDSVEKQSYGNFDLSVAWEKSAEETMRPVVSRWKARSALGGKTHAVVIPQGADYVQIVEAAAYESENEWVLPVVAGDQLRPDALQVFAANIVVRPDWNGVYAVARTRSGEKLSWGGPQEMAADGRGGPFACVGAFVFRRSGGGPGYPLALRSFEHGEARLTERLFAAPPVGFACHILLGYDDGPGGRDPGASRLAACQGEFLRRRAWLPEARSIQDRELEEIRRSPFFDKDWYARENPDVVHARINMFLHYAKEGVSGHSRNPSPDFVGDEYLALNPDALESGESPIVHFERYGRKNGRPTSFLHCPDGKNHPHDYDKPKRLRISHQSDFPSKVATIAARRKGEPVRALFLVSSASMFPARPLFDAMSADPAFLARLFVIPDFRGIQRDPSFGRAVCRNTLGKAYPDDFFIEASPDTSGGWPDVIGDFGADIVCYPSPYDLSCFRFNPHWAVGRDFLPIYISYSFSTSIHGYEVYGRQNYAYFWKVFTECEANAKEYAEHSILNGANAETVGYFKMDALATANPWPRNGNRRRVLIAPHHSVEGGANDSLALSNFQRYADYFLALPERHPELDFVFRPHPFLFTVLAHPSKWGRAKVDDWISRMKAHPNVRWSDEGDYFPAFASCDAIVQDCGSYLAEWVYTGKPCCFMLKAPSDIETKFTPLGREILSHCYLAYDEPAIESFLRDVVEGGSDPKAAARDEFRKSIMVNYPHAAGAALASIKKALGIASHD